MSYQSKLLKLINDPLYSLYWGKAKISPRSYLGNLHKQGQDLKLSRPTFILSFDCDTPADIEASLRLYKKFSNNNIYPVIAAPADIIEQGLDTFKELADMGAVFLNHGSLNHAGINSDGEVYSTLTYCKMTDADWINDIKQGHIRLKKYLGIEAKGFRTPHFGELNSPKDLKKLYNILIDLGYSYSSSTTPLFAPLAHRSWNWSSGQITEFPVNGLIDNPTQIIDSWSFSQPGINTDHQVQQIINSLKQYCHLFSADEKILVNIYFDPSQLEKQNNICNEILSFSKWAIKSYDSLLVTS